MLLHKQSILDCRTGKERKEHREEVKLIVGQICTMRNYLCFLHGTNETWGDIITKKDDFTRQCHLRQIQKEYLNTNIKYCDFYLDEGDLIAIIYTKESKAFMCCKTSLAISALVHNGPNMEHVSLDNIFLKFSNN